MKHYKIINKNIFSSQFGGNIKDFYILSYNVSWEAMTSKLCYTPKICCSNGICKSNILDNIKYNINKYSPDFAVFQEASEHHDIINLFDSTIYDNYVNFSGRETMLSIWNKQKYSLVNAYNYEFESGRPFAILILKNISNNKNIALINLHAGHIVDTQESIFNIINKFIKTEINSNIKKSITRVLMCGDFNRNVYEDETSKYIIKFSDEFKLKRYPSNKYTCCTVYESGHQFIYDHVLDSKSNAIKKITGNPTLKYKYPASDHILIVVNLKK